MKAFALPVVLFFMALGGALAVGGAFVARTQAAGQRAISRGVLVDGLAEQWIATTVAEWDSTAAGVVGSTAVLPAFTVAGGGVSRWLTRADTSVYWIVVQVDAVDKPLQRRRLGATVIKSGNRLLLPPGWGWIELP